MLEQQLFLSKQVAELLRRGCKPRALESQLEEADFTRHKALTIFAAQQRESFAFHCHNTQPKDPAPLMPGFTSRSTRRPQALSGNAQPGRVRPAPRVSAAQHSTAQRLATPHPAAWTQDTQLGQAARPRFPDAMRSHSCQAPRCSPGRAAQPCAEGPEDGAQQHP